jgi:predicted metalloprotease with PDZ domain
LSHAFLDGSSAWLTEGIATYYETILRARAGWVSAEVASRQLDGGFVRGERGGTGRTLRDESEDRHRTGAYDRVYWAGAAIALLVDVALRAEGSSLDEALARAWPSHEETLTDVELLLALDGGTPGTATRIASPWLSTSTFPDLSPAYRALGVARTDAGLTLDDTGAALRTALFETSPALAEPPERCGR